ncbi:MAG: ABC transporter substrate-binding protein [Desulfobacterales bacterium]|jgi:phospholipid transport system substrate-binding protein|nr:ABC transporter substrate-binding protein [Desulfobacterales bacterium]
MKKRLIIALLLVSLTTPFAAYANTPMETLQAYVARVLSVLRDPALKDEAGKKIKTDKIQLLAEELFDFPELSRRTLGQSWKRFTPTQQTEFIALYKTLLQKTYAEKIVSYDKEEIAFGKERPLSEKTSEVETSVATQTTPIAINYRLIHKKGKWAVYDVIIEGVSLINNYRSQFREILANNSPEGLLDVMRKKVS